VPADFRGPQPGGGVVAGPRPRYSAEYVGLRRTASCGSVGQTLVTWDASGGGTIASVQG